jgi:hypothetical protein
LERLVHRNKPSCVVGRGSSEGHEFGSGDNNDDVDGDLALALQISLLSHQQKEVCINSNLGSVSTSANLGDACGGDDDGDDAASLALAESFQREEDELVLQFHQLQMEFDQQRQQEQQQQQHQHQQHQQQQQDWRRALQMQEEEEQLQMQMLEWDEGFAGVESPTPEPLLCARPWHHGIRLHDRKSIFQAHLVPIASSSDAQRQLRSLMTTVRGSASASGGSGSGGDVDPQSWGCWPYAYCCANEPTTNTTVDQSKGRRKGSGGGGVSPSPSSSSATSPPRTLRTSPPSSLTATVMQRRQCDDGGEAGVGSRLSELLSSMKAMNVLVLVSRECYGGMLGGVRFNHFLHCARELLEEYGYDTRHTRGKIKKSKCGKAKSTSNFRQLQPGSYEVRTDSKGRPELHYIPTKQEASYTKAHMEHC